MQRAICESINMERETYDWGNRENEATQGIARVSLILTYETNEPVQKSLLSFLI